MRLGEETFDGESFLINISSLFIFLTPPPPQTRSALTGGSPHLLALLDPKLCAPVSV